jgi:hypothetical protein
LKCLTVFTLLSGTSFEFQNSKRSKFAYNRIKVSQDFKMTEQQDDTDALLARVENHLKEADRLLNKPAQRPPFKCSLGDPSSVKTVGEMDRYNEVWKKEQNRRRQGIA